ncbi:MAG TPA: hypothetical protein VN626_10220 [Clostridia bacterium]|nr:hypothetical protein [Clostridia bacterium]
MRWLNIRLLFIILIMLSTACSERNLGLSSPYASSVAPSGQSQPQAASQSSENSASASQAATNAAAKYADILSKGTYYIDCTAAIEMEGMQLENTMLIAVKNGNSSISVSSDLSGMLVTMRTLVFDGNVYQVNDAQRSYTQIDSEQSANSFDTDFSSLRYIGEGIGTFFGETLPCSEYERGEQTVRFFLNDNTLLGLTQSIIDEQVSEIMLKINGLSANIPDKLVEMPIGYTKE